MDTLQIENISTDSEPEAIAAIASSGTKKDSFNLPLETYCKTAEILEHQGPVYFFVLGSQLSTEHGPGRMNNRAIMAMAALKYRMERGIGDNDVLVLSGGQTTKGLEPGHDLSDLSEAEHMLRFLKAQFNRIGVTLEEISDKDREDIRDKIQSARETSLQENRHAVPVVIDNKAASTRQNMRFATSVIPFEEDAMLVIIAGEIAPADNRVRDMIKRLQWTGNNPYKIIVTRAIENNPNWFSRFMSALGKKRYEEAIREIPFVERVITIVTKNPIVASRLDRRAEETRIAK